VHGTQDRHETGTQEFFRAHLHAHQSYAASGRDSLNFRAPIRSADRPAGVGQESRRDSESWFRV
jgi:hypothetical protein